MYLTAQRVVSPSSGATGVNAYCYIHGFDWTSPPDSILDALPNEPSSEHIEVPPPATAFGVTSTSPCRIRRLPKN